MIIFDYFMIIFDYFMVIFDYFMIIFLVVNFFYDEIMYQFFMKILL